MKKGNHLLVAFFYFLGLFAFGTPFTTTDEAAVKDFSRRLDWSYEAAWKETNGERETVSLCGMWRFAPQLEPTDAPPPISSPGWAWFIVPGHWRGCNVSNYIHTDDGKTVTHFMDTPVKDIWHGWYRRTLDVPASWKGKTVIWAFNHLVQSGRIYLNGEYLADTSSFDTIHSAKFDITDKLRYGELNEFAVRCDTDVNEIVGIRGFTYLQAIPKENFGEPYVAATLYRERRIELAFRHPVISKGTLKVTLRNWKTGETEFSQEYPFAPRISIDYMPRHLWSPEEPNLYFMDLSMERNGRTLDARTIRFGFADVWSDGPDYYLNGRKISLMMDTALDNGDYCTVDWKMGKDYIRRQLKSMRALNINATYFNPNMSKGLLDVYDEEGVMVVVASNIPYRQHKDSSDDDVFATFQRKILDLKESDYLDNHPSHVAYQIDVWFNYHNGTTNAEFIGMKGESPMQKAFDADGNVVEVPGGDPNMRGTRGDGQRRLNHIAQMYREAFPGKLVVTGADGEVGDSFATHIYHTWGAPFEEMRALFYRYALQRELPIFIGEYNIPYPGSMYEIFNFKAGDATPLAAENFARYAGNDGYRWRTIYGRRVLHDMGVESMQASRTELTDGFRYWYVNDAFGRLLELGLENMVPAWRLDGVNGIGFFGYALGNHFSLAGVGLNRYRELPMDLSKPDFYPEYMPGGAFVDAFHSYERPFFVKPTFNGVVLQRVAAPVLVEFMGAGKNRYEQDHAWFGGDTFTQRIGVLNESPGACKFVCVVSLKDASGGIIQQTEEQISVPQNGKVEFDVAFKAPFVASRTTATLCASVQLKGEQVAFARKDVQFFPELPLLRLNRRLTVCDPDGGVAAYLESLGVPFEAIDSLDNAPTDGVLLVGRRGLSLNPTIPDMNELVAEGLNILVLEQDASVSMELMETRSRHAFINAPAHPIFYGLEDEDFSNWQGSVSLAESFGCKRSPGQQWSHAGSQNMVATNVFRRPVHGNYLALLASGFDMFQTPLLEYHGRRASWLASQLEIVPRLGKDPVATRVFHQMLGYLDNRASVTGRTAFFGGETGRAFLDKMKVVSEPLEEISDTSLADVHTLILFDCDFKELVKESFALARFVYQGGHILYLQTGEAFSASWMPTACTLGRAKARKALNTADRPDAFWRNGWGNNELYWHDEFEVPIFEEIPEQANATVPGVLMDIPHGSGRYTLVSITPEVFGDAYAAAKTCRLLCAILTSAGVALENDSQVFVLKSGSKDFVIDLAAFTNWQFALDPEDKGMAENVQRGEFGSLNWMMGLIADGSEVRVGIPFEHFIGKEYDGTVWYRLDLDVPEELLESGEAYFSAGRIDDLDMVFINGEMVGSTGEDTPNYWSVKRNYRIPAGTLHPGRNTIVVRVVDLRGEGGIAGRPVRLSNRPLGGGERVWKSPYQNAAKRDYDYPQDAIRQY